MEVCGKYEKVLFELYFSVFKKEVFYLNFKKVDRISRKHPNWRWWELFMRLCYKRCFLRLLGEIAQDIVLVLWSVFAGILGGIALFFKDIVCFILFLL
jgi:hypothetical protein